MTLVRNSAADVLAVLASLQVTLADDDDTNFALVVSGAVTVNQLGRGPVNVPFSLPYAVTVAVADTPIVDVGAFEQDDCGRELPNFATHPVIVSLNDTDGSRRTESIVIAFNIGSALCRTSVRFGRGYHPYDSPGQVTLTGTPALEAALLASRCGPSQQRRSITVTVTRTSVESN
jgi:hypothetical protein